MLIATLATAVGFAFDAGSGNRELSGVFAALYLMGCVAAVLAVRQEAIFTAVVQPPLILFVSVPGAYFLFHLSDIQGIKDILINCGYPLIERFLLMFTTSVIVLLIGMARWYFGDAARPAPVTSGQAAAKSTAAVGAAAGVLAAIKTKLSELSMPTRGSAAHDDAEPRKHAIDRDTTTRRRQDPRRPTKRTAPTRSRHVRPPLDDDLAPPPSRRRPTHAREDDDFADGPPPRRRAPRDPSRRPPPPEYLRDPREPRQPRQRSPYERPMPRPERYGPPVDPYPGVDPYDGAPPPPRRRPAPASGTHHPVSKVRYRGADAGDDGSTEGAQYRRRPRSSRGTSDRYRDFE